MPRATQASLGYVGIPYVYVISILLVELPFSLDIWAAQKGTLLLQGQNVWESVVDLIERISIRMVVFPIAINTSFLVVSCWPTVGGVRQAAVVTAAGFQCGILAFCCTFISRYLQSASEESGLAAWAFFAFQSCLLLVLACFYSKARHFCRQGE